MINSSRLSGFKNFGEEGEQGRKSWTNVPPQKRGKLNHKIIIMIPKSYVSNSSGDSYIMTV